MTHSKPIGITSGRVTEIKVESKDMPRGQVKRRKPLLQRPRRCLRTSQAHELVSELISGARASELPKKNKKIPCFTR
jgi:hypothetical protein